MRFTSNLYLDGIPFAITADFCPGETMVISSDGSGYPGSPDDVDVESISFGGENLNQAQIDFLIESYGQQLFYGWLFDAAYDKIKQRKLLMI